MSKKVPPAFKSIASYIRIANENASREPVVYYWCLFYAVQTALKLDRSSPEAMQFITGLLTTLEAVKKQLANNDAVQNETVAQAHLEDFSLKLFNFADAKEKTGNVDKAVVHAFYTAGYVMDVLSLFGEIEEPFKSSKKYAKWKSTQIFACLKDGTPYVPSTQQQKSEDDELAEFSQQFNPTITNPTPQGPAAPSVQEHFYNQPVAPSYPAQPAQPTPTYPPQPNPSYPVQPSQPETYAEPTPSGAHPTAEEFNEVRKFAKYAISSIDYEDTKAIRDYLQKALAVLQKY